MTNVASSDRSRLPSGARSAVRAILGLSACLSLALATGCDGGTSGEAGEISASGPSLVRIEVGRLVDVYAWRRVDPSVTGQLDPTERTPTPIAENVVIRGDIVSDTVVDPATNPNAPIANYRFLPFDISVGRERLLILWDDRFESERFDAAFSGATTGLTELEPATFGQNPLLDPLPVVPRNAAFELTFDQPLGAATEVFRNNPEAIQLLRIDGDVNTLGADVLTQLPVRIVAREDIVILDPTILGGEAAGVGVGSPGLPPSPDQRLANIRIALPTTGDVADLLGFAEDREPSLNGRDALGNMAVIRDFRAASLEDPNDVLPDLDAPAVVGRFEIGILQVDAAQRRLRIDKRGANVAIRGRVPFVDGQRPAVGATPGGPSSVPTVAPLAAGDLIRQSLLTPSGRPVTLTAEVLEVLDVGLDGLTPANTDGGELDVIDLVVSSVSFEIDDEVVAFRADATAAGADAVAQVRYVENVPYTSGGVAVSDAGRRASFFEVSSSAVSSGDSWTDVDPTASVTVAFSEPLDVPAMSSLDNLFLASSLVGENDLVEALDEPKRLGLAVAPSNLIDLNADGTTIRLFPPLGLSHAQGTPEEYWLHLVGGELGDPVRDLSGNPLDVWDRRPENESQGLPRETLSLRLVLDGAAPDNAIGWRVFRFADVDEDGSAPSAGATDWFGQGELADGRLVAAPANRRRLTVDVNNMPTISRFDRGECLGEEDTAFRPFTQSPNRVPLPPPFAGHPVPNGFLYQVPSFLFTARPILPGPPAYTFGGVSEPHVRFGARQQMTYRPDDFGLDPKDPGDFNIDVEQLYWSPWQQQPLAFDMFERYTMRLSHADKRPDLRFDIDITPAFGNPMDPNCSVDCFSVLSGLDTNFASNVLQGSQAKAVVQDAEYVINPSEALEIGDVTYIAYPEFESTYTWRDSRLVSWSEQENTAIGLGGARDAATPGDLTANISSPWIPDDLDRNLRTGDPLAPTPIPGQVRPLLNGFTQDFADFLGDRTRDHDPIALPLLVDLWVYPDSETGSVATTGNQFHIGFVGPNYRTSNPVDGPSGYNPQNGANAGGFYNFGVSFCGLGGDPFFRVYSRGANDPLNPLPVIVNPAQETTANGGLVISTGLPGGQTQVLPGDGHLNWAAIDLVRRVSLLTFGFFDTLQPNRNALGAGVPTNGFPNLAASGSGASDIVFLRSQEIAPGDSRILVEFRGLEDADRIGTIWNPNLDDRFDSRGNLLNPHYACEAYRYASANPGQSGSGPRVTADGITDYALSTEIDRLRDPLSGLLPRFLNMRVTLENDLSSDDETLRPSIGGFAAVWRVE